MADLSTTKLISLSQLTTYDTKIKAYIAEEAGDAAAASIKSIAEDSTNHKIKFYKEEASKVEASTVPVYTLDLGSVYSDLTTLKADSSTTGSVAYDILQAIGALGNDSTGAAYANVKAYVDDKDTAIKNDLGAVSTLKTTAKTAVTSINEIYDNIGTTALGTTATTISGAVAELKGNIDTINGSDTTTGSIAKAVKDAKDTIEGEIGTVPKKAGGADQTVVEYIDSKAGDSSAVSKVTIDEISTGLASDILKSYEFYQGLTGEETSEQKAAKKIGTISLAKDLVVTSGEVVVDPEGQTAGTYLKLTIANQTEPVYINVASLCDVYTSEQNASQVQVTISSANVVSAEIVDGSVDTAALGADAVTNAKVADDAIQTENIKDANVTAAKLAADSIVATITSGTVSSSTMDSTVVSLLQKANDAVQASDITLATDTDVNDLFKKTTE